MYSHHYRYYLLRSDAAYARPLAVDIAVSACLGAGMLAGSEPLSFVGPADMPWCSLSLVRATPNGSYASDVSAREVNAAPFVCLRASPVQRHESLLKRIAMTLKWQLVLEEDDDGNENVVLFEGSPSPR
jgi:hypothetical protein